MKFFLTEMLWLVYSKLLVGASLTETEFATCTSQNCTPYKSTLCIYIYTKINKNKLLVTKHPLPFQAKI